MKSHTRLRSGRLPFRVGGLPMLLVPAMMIGLMPGSAKAATLVVTSLGDPGVGGCTASGNGDGCTLREAIVAANNQTLTPGDDTINATALNGTISLGTALPPLTTNIVLNGPGPTKLTVERFAFTEFRIFTIDNTTTSGPTVVLTGLTLSGGRVSGGSAPANCGGAIYNNHGTLTVSNSVFKNNAATNGGAICNDGSVSVSATLALSGSTFSGNSATGGGAIFNNGSQGGSAPLAITSCIFSDNDATSGGAILNDGHSGGSATITQLSTSSLTGNTASGNGGAIENDGHAGGSATLAISKSTLSGNSAANGGAIANNGSGGSATQAISNSTFSANSASTNGGAINNDGRVAGSGTVAIGTSTFNGNTAGVRGGLILNNGTGGSATVKIDNSTLKANTAASSSAAIDSDGTGGSATLAIGSTILANAPSANIKMTVNSATTFLSNNHNLSSDAAGGDGTTGPGGPYLTAGGDVRNTDPKLDTLKNNGGPTLTLALLAGSPAIDKAVSNQASDQRGFPRPVDNLSVVNASGGDGSDIGAYERNISGLSINDVTVTEGNSGTVNATFTVQLAEPSAQTVTVKYATAVPGSFAATPGVDYLELASTTLTFAPGQTSKAIVVQVKGDTLDEINERFSVKLSSPTNTTIADSEGFGTINDDDAAPTLTINDAVVTEGNSGTVFANFTVTLSAVSSKTVTVTYATATPGSIPATAGVDYVAIPATTLTFAPGQTTKAVVVQVKGDTLDEGDERFVVNLSSAGNATIADNEGFGTIVDDDAAPSLSIGNVTLAEGNSGKTAFVFTVTLSGVSGKMVTVQYQTTTPSSLIATPGTDYTALPPTTLSIAAGQTTGTVTVQVNGDTTVEGTERFVVKLSTPTNATLSNSEGFGTINNDDVAPLLAEDDAPSE